MSFLYNGEVDIYDRKDDAVMKKRNWLLNNLYLICSLLWFAVAGLKLLNGNEGGIYIWVILGLLYLCLHLIQRGRIQEEKRKEEMRNM